jgi:hypothetical protein
MKMMTLKSIGSPLRVRLCVMAAVMQEAVFGQANYTTPYTITTIAGRPDVSGTANGTNGVARFYTPVGIAMDNATNIYVTDNGNDEIRRVTPGGTNWVVTTVSGLANNPGSANGTGDSARFDLPQAVAVDNSGNIYVADTGNDTIRKLSLVGTNWVVTTLVGQPGNAASIDGTNGGARFDFPDGVAVDSATNIYVADELNNTIRKVAPVGTNWVVTTIAGRAGSSGSADGTNGAARFNGPDSVALDTSTNLYVADEFDNTIRKVTPVGTNWVVTTIAGLAGVSGAADGAGKNAQFYSPNAIAVDSADNLYVADSGNNTIRKVTPVGTNWVVTTLAGKAGYTGSADGTGSVARFYEPGALAVDSKGNVYVTDAYNETIRKGVPPLIISSYEPNPVFNTGQFGFTLSGPGGQTVVVDASDDLENWLPIWTNMLTFPAVVNFTDSEPSTNSTRFYRARMP